MSQIQALSFDEQNRGCLWEQYEKTVENVYGAIPEVLIFARQHEGNMNASRMQEETNIPDEFANADLSKFKFDVYSHDTTNLKAIVLALFNDFKKWETCGKGLYLWSRTPGSGKTFLMCCIARSIMYKYHKRVRFINITELVPLIMENAKRDRGATDKIDVLKKCDLLVIDDIGAHMGSNFQEQEIYRLVDYRYTKGLPTFFTSNVPIKKLNVEERTKSRISKMVVELTMIEESVRDKKAREEQETFLKSILGDSMAEPIRNKEHTL